MYADTTVHRIVGLLMLFVTFSTAGCQMIRKPDNCDHEPRCELDDGATVQWREPAIGESREVLICACSPWNASGITVREGQHYAFDITEVRDWTDGTVTSHPTLGWQGGSYRALGFMISFLKRSDRAPWYALIGTVGRDDETSFAVIERSAGTVTIHQSGPLYFYANDMRGRYHNNRGTLVLRITRNQQDQPAAMADGQPR